MQHTERPTLSREVIALAALEMIDAEGLAGLSMRKLGATLGVEAMSLYHYVANKHDLLDAALEQIYLEIDVPEFVGPEDWGPPVRAGLRSFRDALARHPNAISLFATQPAISPGAFAVFRTAHRRLVQAGLDPAAAHRALGVLVSFVLGHVVFDSGSSSGLSTLDLVELTDGTDPEVVSFVQSGRSLADDSFESGIDTILAGLCTLFDLP